MLWGSEPTCCHQSTECTAVRRSAPRLHLNGSLAAQRDKSPNAVAGSKRVRDNNMHSKHIHHRMGEAAHASTRGPPPPPATHALLVKA